MNQKISKWFLQYACTEQALLQLVAMGVHYAALEPKQLLFVLVQRT